MIDEIRPQDRLMAMDRSTIWPYFPMLFSLIFDRAPPNFDILGACTAFIGMLLGVERQISFKNYRGKLTWKNITENNHVK